MLSDNNGSNNNSNRSRRNPNLPLTIDVRGKSDQSNNDPQNPTKVHTQHNHHHNIAMAFTSEESSPDIEGAIRGFKNELDSLSRSFDLLASSHSKSHSQRGSSGENSPTEAPATSATRHETPSQHTRFDTSYRSSSVPFDPTGYVDPPPPPSQKSTAPESGYSTRDHPADETFLTSTTATRFEEPRPVDTPMVASTRHQKTSTSSSRYHHSQRNSHTGDDDDPYLLATDSFEGAFQKMKETVRQQSDAIRKLQRENDDLRRRLALAEQQNHGIADKRTLHEAAPRLEPMLDGSNYRQRHDPRYTYHTYERHTQPHHSSRPEERYHYHYNDVGPAGSSLSTLRSTPPRDSDEENAGRNTTTPRGGAVGPSGFTPGTKFVAELSKYMAVNQGHNVPLSVIIDRHWDKLKHINDEY